VAFADRVDFRPRIRAPCSCVTNDCHSRPLARQDRHRGDAGGQGCLPAQAIRRLYSRRTVVTPPPGSHHREWIDAIKRGQQAPESSNFAYAAKMTEPLLLGNIALRLGREVEWDADKMQVRGAPEADQYIKPTYRAGWELSS